MPNRVRHLAIAFRFKTKYLTLNILERKILIDECIDYLETLNDSDALLWFNNQKIIHDVSEDEFRKSEVMSHAVWQNFYQLIMTSTNLRDVVETFLENS